MQTAQCRASQYTVFQRLDVWIICGQGDSNLCLDASYAAGIRAHYFANCNDDTSQIQPVILSIDSHNGFHTGGHC